MRCKGPAEHGERGLLGEAKRSPLQVRQISFGSRQQDQGRHRSRAGLPLQAGGQEHNPHARTPSKGWERRKEARALAKKGAGQGSRTRAW